MELKKLNNTIKELVLAKKAIAEASEHLKTLRLAETELKNKVEQALREAETDAWKIKDVATVGIKKNKPYYKITDEKTLVSALQANKGLAKEYLDQRPNDFFLNALKAGVEWELDGLQKVEGESFYIRINKEKNE